MAKGDGVVYNVIGLIIGVVSIFLAFSQSGSVPFVPSNWIVYIFQDPSVFVDQLGHLGEYFTNFATVDFGLWVLFPIFFIVACVCILFGIRHAAPVGFGAVIFLLYPLAYLILVVIVPAFTGGDIATLFLTLKEGFYVMLIAGILCAIGASKNSED